jgi:uncharacterized membrane protein YfcA
MDNLSYLLFIAFGLVVGTYGSIVGAGGGFLIVPMLLWYKLSPQQAIGTSLIVVFLNALSGAISYARQRRIDYHAGIRFALWVLPGAVIGIFLSTLFSVKTFSLAFGVLLLVIAVFLLFKPVALPEERLHRSESDAAWWKRRTSRTLMDDNGIILSYSYHTLSGYLISFLVGFVSSLFGIGGGIVHVPAMVHLLRIPAHVATATSLFILTISAGIGAFGHVLLGNVLPTLAITIGFGVIIGAQCGAAISRRLHGLWIVRLLALALVAVAIRLLTS